MTPKGVVFSVLCLQTAKWAVLQYAIQAGLHCVKQAVLQCVKLPASTVLY